MVEKNTGSDLPAGASKPRFFYGIISLTALAATLVVIIILSGNSAAVRKTANTPESAEAGRLSELREALQADPENPGLNLDLGNLLFDMGNFRESVVYYRRVVSLDPGHVAARIDLGVCYFNLGQADSALIEMKKALEIDQYHVKGLFNIGVIYYNLGQNAQARKYWEELIRRHEGSQEAQIARQMLENINT